MFDLVVGGFFLLNTMFQFDAGSRNASEENDV